MKTLESRKRTNSNTACPKSNSTSFESCRTTGTKQRNVKQNTRGKQKWKVARLEKARERLRGGVCYFANNPAENFHFDREKRRWKGGGGGEGTRRIAATDRTMPYWPGWLPYGSATVCSPRGLQLSPTCYTHRTVLVFCDYSAATMEKPFLRPPSLTPENYRFW